MPRSKTAYRGEACPHISPEKTFLPQKIPFPPLKKRAIKRNDAKFTQATPLSTSRLFSAYLADSPRSVGSLASDLIPILLEKFSLEVSIPLVQWGVSQVKYSRLHSV